MDAFHYGSAVEKNSNGFFIDAHRDVRIENGPSWKKHPINDNSTFLLFSVPGALWILIGVFFFLTRADGMFLLYLICSPFLVILALMTFRMIWPLRGCFRLILGTTDIVVNVVQQNMKTDRLRVIRISSKSTVVEIDDGDILMCITSVQTNPDRVIVHLHPNRRSERNRIEQVMASINKGLMTPK